MRLHQAIGHAVALMRSPASLEELSVYKALVERGVERHVAARLVEFLPMVYCRLVLAKTAVRFPDVYRRALSDGNLSAPIQFSADSIWNEAVAFAQVEADSVMGRELLAIAGRSAEFDAANKLLNGGTRLEDIRLTEPVLLWPASGPEFDS